MNIGFKFANAIHTFRLKRGECSNASGDDPWTMIIRLTSWSAITEKLYGWKRGWKDMKPTVVDVVLCKSTRSGHRVSQRGIHIQRHLGNRRASIYTEHSQLLSDRPRAPATLWTRPRRVTNYPVIICECLVTYEPEPSIRQGQSIWIRICQSIDGQSRSSLGSLKIRRDKENAIYKLDGQGSCRISNGLR